MSQKPTRDIHAEITRQLIAAIEKDPGDPQLPWRRTGGKPLFCPENALSKAPYRGINVIALWAAAEIAGHSLPIWATYRQWQELGCQVRQGERASPIVFYKEFAIDPDDADDDGRRRVARGYNVFNAAQVDGFTAPAAPPDLGPIERIATAERFIAAIGADIRHGGERAFFSPAGDFIQMPGEGLFAGTDTMSRSEGWYATLLHEHVHWTSAPNRLDRQLGKRFADRAYAAEELVAEIGAAFLCSALSITQEVRPDHARYLAHWLQLIKDDDRAIFTAAAAAQRAVAFLEDKAGTTPQPERTSMPASRSFIDPSPK